MNSRSKPIVIAAMLALLLSHRGAAARQAPVLAAKPAPLAAQSDGRAVASPPPKPDRANGKAASVPSDFEIEQRMSFRQRMKRWDSFVVEAAKRFQVPQIWIRAVMQAESGGRTLSGEGRPITSSAGALGLMQIMPSTYDDMRRQYALGADPHDPHDNILAGAAYLRWLRGKYGYPGMFAAYNDGPGDLEDRLRDGGLLPIETRNYLAGVTGTLNSGNAGHRDMARFTRPNGTPVWIDAAAAVSVRAALPGEYAPGVRAVIAVGRLRQGVRESVARTRATLRAHGGGV